MAPKSSAFGQNGPGFKPALNADGSQVMLDGYPVWHADYKPLGDPLKGVVFVLDATGDWRLVKIED